jgi:colanic acid biosynthesis glycosyl transferase WcaI
MRFLILTQYFPPEIGGPQTRLKCMTAELKRLGHEIEIVTALPNYPRGHFFPGYERCLYRREVRDDVIVHRVWLFPAMGGGLRRMLNYGSFMLTSFLGLLRAKRPDYIFVESPPIFLSIPAYIAGFFWNVPFLFNVADLWPDSIVEGGFLKEGFLMESLRNLERWSYRKATYINAVTEGIRDSLLCKKSVPPEKILFLPNGVDTILYRPRPSDAALKTKLGLDGKRIILWAGTLGHAHGLDHVLHAAKLLENCPEVHFLFVGDGSARPSLERLQRQLELRNVTFHDPVALEELPPYFSIAESGLASLLGIPLHDGARPSKVFPILASGKPLIFVGKGEGARLVDQAKAGIVVPPENPQALASAVLELLNNPDRMREFGRNGRRFVETNLQWSQLIGSWIARLGQFPPQATGSSDAAQI